MRGILSHLRYSARQLLRAPGFTITAIVILGFGIGANPAIFSLINNGPRITNPSDVAKGGHAAKSDH
ncbi:MAG TPA: hypothetical protein VN939_02310 [Chthoniobacterales bacterium]|nr:hypothetical protein [Chthoniobacterales bacterium]